MQDLIVVIVILGFFGLCVAFVGGCSRILGPDEAAVEDATLTAGDAEPSAEPAAAI